VIFRDVFFEKGPVVIKNRGLAILKLRAPNRAKRSKLEELQASYRRAIDSGLQTVLNATAQKPGEVHALAYPLARQAGLPSMYARLAVNEIAALERKTHRRTQRMPEKRNGLGLPANSYRLVNKNGCWAIRMSLGERGELLWLPLVVPEKLFQSLEKVQGDARLFQRNGTWYAALPFTSGSQTDGIAPAAKSAVTGVDLGIARLATAYADGKVLIIRGEVLVQRRKRMIEHWRKSKPTRTAQLKLLQRRQVAAINHSIATRLVTLAASQAHPVIALEKLDGLLYRQHRSLRFSQMRRAWDFRQLIDLIAYKAQERGIQVMFVDPRGTSTTCPRCRLNLAKNSSPKGRFHCQGCGYASITDIVAARNIAARCVQA